MTKKNIDFYQIFKPELTPKQMLELGVFGGAYFGDKIKELPKSWVKNAKLSEKFDVKINRCRYSNGRRLPKIDEIQIKRWKNFTRHVKAIKKNCEKGDLGCRRRQRQAILQWAYNPFI